MSKINYEFKAKVLREHSELLTRYKQSRLLDYAINEYNDNGVVFKILKNSEIKGVLPSNELFSECAEKDLILEYFEAKKITLATFKRSQRLRKRVESMLLEGKCLFVTLTFRDDVLESTSPKERRVRVTRYLKQCGGRYVANIDFSPDMDREHYHCLICNNHIDMDIWDKQNGFVFVERVRNRNIDRDKKRLSMYIAKLSNHAIKETTKRSALIYSR